MKVDDVPCEPVDERSLSEWRQIRGAAQLEGSVDVIVTEEGPRFYLHEGRTYWLTEDKVIVEATENGAELGWRALDCTGAEIAAGVCSGRWPEVVKGRQPPWPAGDVRFALANSAAR